MFLETVGPNFMSFLRRLSARSLVLSLVLCPLAAASFRSEPSAAAVPAVAPADSWPASRGDSGGNHDNPGERAITSATVSQLRPAWSLDTNNVYSEPVISLGVAYAPIFAADGRTQSIEAVQVATGNPLWQTPLGTLGGSRGMVIAGGTLYVFGDASTGNAGGVTAISLANHKILWIAFLSPGIFNWVSYREVFDFAIDSGRIYIIGDSGNIDVFNSLTGARIWTQRADVGPAGLISPITGPLAALDGRVIYNDSTGQHVRDGASGRILWTPDERGYPDVAAGKLYLSDNQGVRSYPWAGCGKATCTRTWSAPVTTATGDDTADVAVTVSGADAASLIVTETWKGYALIRALNAGNGSTVWSDSPKIAAASEVALPATRAADVVYVFVNDALLAYSMQCRVVCRPYTIAETDEANDYPNARIAVASGTVLVQRWIPSQVDAYAIPSRAELGPNGSLKVGQQLRAGTFLASMQTDGNFVVYGRKTWSTRTSRTAAVGLDLQSDGNLVLYPAAGRALWSSRTVGKGGVRLIMQTDGNLVLYTAAGRPVWASRTS